MSYININTHLFGYVSPLNNKCKHVKKTMGLTKVLAVLKTFSNFQTSTHPKLQVKC